MSADPEMDEIVQEFLAESAEGLDLLERELVELERSGSDPERLAAIFRVLHTLKGNSSVLGFGQVQSIAHAGEDLLGRLREGSVAMTSEMAGGLLAVVDALRERVANIKRCGDEGGADPAAVVRRLEHLLEPTAQSAAAPGPAEQTNAVAASPGERLDAEPIRVRVDVDLLDHLMDLCGELVLARNQLVRLAGAAQARSGLQTALQRLKAITAQLQDAVMQARLQPIGILWDKFPRLLRDLALQCGKQITVELEGSQTELDRALVETVRDPLTHIVRNAVDHGIEPPEQRLRAGKPAEGKLRLRAWHEGGRICIEVSDDGAGVDFLRVRECAVERGLIAADRAAQMSETEAIQLLFAPGFSTSGQVSNLSGRGVGLDVVKTNIERIGGRIELRSVAGRGTTVELCLPLTVLAMPALLVTSGEQRFAVPHAKLREVVRLESGDALPGVEQVCGAPVFRNHGRLLPLCFLDDVLRLPRQRRSTLHVLVLQGTTGPFGLVVDDVEDSEDLIAKPISRRLNPSGGFAGAAILSQGEVILIVDAAGVAELAGLLPLDNFVAAEGALDAPADDDDAAESWLLCESAGGTRLAVPLSAVVRLEEVSRGSIERLHRGEVMRYESGLVPLVRTGDLPGRTGDGRDSIPVVVLAEGERRAALAVERIEDIVDEAIQALGGTDRLLAGPVVIQKRPADLLNVPELFASLERAAGSPPAADGV